MHANQPPVFIVGCDRSGTTLLRLMLTQSSELHVMHETGFIKTLYARRSEYGDFTQSRQRWFFIRDLQQNAATSKTNSFSAFDLDPDEAESRLSKAAPLKYIEAVRTFFSAAAAKHNATRWGDKTPDYIVHLRWLAQRFPDAQFVHIIRDGRDVALSIHRAGWKPSLWHAAQYWKDRVKTGRSSGASLSANRYYEVYYEDLVRHSETTLKDVCSWLQLPFEPAMLRFHQKSNVLLPDAHHELYQMTHQPIDPSRAQAWKHTLSSRDIADVEDAAGDLLAELGYELTGAQVPLWLRMLRATREHTADYTRAIRHKMERLGMS